MKRNLLKSCFVLLLCVWLVMGALAVSAETTTIAAETGSGQTTTAAPTRGNTSRGNVLTVPREVSVTMIVIGVALLLLAAAMLCAFIFGFPRWGLMVCNKPKKAATKKAAAPREIAPAAQAVEESSAVSLEDLF